VTEQARQHPMFTLAILSLGTVSYALLQSAVVPALPDLQRNLHTSETGVAWVLTAYLLSASVATPIVGRLGDMFGKERMLLWTYVVLAAGTLMAALANSIGVLDASRVIQGFGGGVFPLTFGIIRDEFPRDRIPGAIGLLSAIFGIGGGLGIVAGGLIVEHLNWHWLFWLPLVALVVAAVLTARFVPESPVRVPGRINWLSGVLMAGGLAAILLAISEATVWGWGSQKTIGLMALGFAVCAVWVIAELRSAEPLVDMGMMRLRGVWTTNLAGFLLGGGMFASFVLVPQFVETPSSNGYGFGATVLSGGIYLLPATLTMLVTGAAAGPIARRIGSKGALVAGAAVGAASFGVLIGGHDKHWQIYLVTALLGVGVGLAFAALGNLIVQAVPAGQTGVATGMNTVMRTVGGAVGSQIAATLLAENLRASGYPEERAYVFAFMIGLAFLIVCFLSSLLVPGRRDAQAEFEPARLQPQAE
jgi:EmrB/QacA subfamily drug resistance transporter